MQLLIKNGLVLQRNGTFLKGNIGIEQGKIASLWYGGTPGGEAPDNRTPPDADAPHIDAEGFLISPGFIDTHTHGGNTFSFSYPKGEAEAGGWKKMEERLVSTGVTSILATGTSLPPDDTFNFIDRTAALAEGNNTNKVEILGIYMEGPYINKSRKGAHREECIRPASKEELNHILERAVGLIKVWALAPEIKENMAIIETLAAAGISVSIAHSDAGHNTAMAAFSAGANRVTHTFNGMPPISHRYEGIITAAWEHGAFMELIADGHHVSPAIVKMFMAASDPGKVVLITDNNEYAGQPDGSYIRGSQCLIVANGQMKTESGSLAGSIVGLNTCACNCTRWGSSIGAALKTVTENPALSIGVFDRKGSISPGKDADMVILDGQCEAMVTLRGGRIVYRSDRFPGAVSGC